MTIRGYTCDDLTKSYLIAGFWEKEVYDTPLQAVLASSFLPQFKDNQNGGSDGSRKTAEID